MADITVISDFSSRAEAELARGYLSSQGIEAQVRSDDCGSVDPALAFGRGAQLVIESELADKARAALAQAAEDAAKAKDEAADE